MAGREMPRTRPMRSSAAAIVAPVFPAPTMAWARPLRVLARGVFRFGTAMGCLSVSAQVEIGQRRPARVRRLWLFGDDVRRAGCTTGGLARRGERQLEEHDVPHQLLEVDLVAVERVRVALDGLGLEQLADLGRER